MGPNFLSYGEMDALLRSFRLGRKGASEALVTWPSGRTETVVASPGRTMFLKLIETVEGCDVTGWVIRWHDKVSLTVQYKQADGIVYGGTNSIADGKSTVKVYAITDVVLPDDGLSGCTEWA
jgi:hypothetical protein